MARRPGIRVGRLERPFIDVPVKTKGFVNELVRTIYGAPQEAYLTDSLIRELEMLFAKTKMMDVLAAAGYYGNLYLEQRRDLKWTPTELVNCYIFVPQACPEPAETLTGPFINQLMAHTAHLTTPATDREQNTAQNIRLHSSQWDAIVYGLGKGGKYVFKPEDTEVDPDHLLTSVINHDGISYSDAVLYGYYTGVRYKQLTTFSDAPFSSILNAPLSEVWVHDNKWRIPSYTKPQVDQTTIDTPTNNQSTTEPNAPTEAGPDMVHNESATTNNTVNLDTGETVPPVVDSFITGLANGLRHNCSSGRLQLSNRTVSWLTQLLNGCSNIQASAAGWYYGELYRTSHSVNTWPIEIYIECRLYHPGHASYLAGFKLRPDPQYLDLVKRIDEWSVAETNKISKERGIYPIEPSLAWGSNRIYAAAPGYEPWAPQSGWVADNGIRGSGGFIEGLTTAVNPNRGVRADMLNPARMSLLNMRYGTVDRSEAWLVGYYTGLRYLDLNNRDGLTVEHILNDDFLEHIWTTPIKRQVDATRVNVNLEMAIFQYGLTGMNKPVIQLGELSTARALELLESGYNSRINVVCLPHIQEVQDLIITMKSW